MRLDGSDTSERSIQGARDNLGAAGLEGDLRVGDARELAKLWPDHRFDAIVSNPPFGRRVGPNLGHQALFEALLDGIEQVTAAGARVALLVLWGAVALFFAFLAVVFVAVLILVAFWESRVLTASLLAVSFFALALIAAFVARHQIAAKPRPFDASLNELAKDREQLTPRP